MMKNLSATTYHSILDINQNQWNHLVSHTTLGSIYHRYEWLKTIEESTDLKPAHIVISKHDNPIGILPNFIEKIPKTFLKLLYSINVGYSGPLITSHESQVIDLILQQIKTICKKNILSHTIRTNQPDFIRYSHSFSSKGYTPSLTFCRSVLPLKHKDFNDIYNDFENSRKREIKKANKKEITIEDEPLTTENLKDFHNDYTQLMQRVKGYIHPFIFLEQLQNNFNKRVKLFTVFKENEKIGSHLYLLNKEQSTIVHWLSSVKEDYFSYYPTILLHAHVIQWAIKQNYDTYDFGMSKANINNGIFKYKEGFNAKHIPVIIWTKPYSKIGYPLFHLMVKLYKKNIIPQTIHLKR